MALQIEPLPNGGSLGMIVRGVTETLLTEPDVRSRLRQAWIDHGLLVFKGPASARLQIALSRVFGQLAHHPVEELWIDGCPELIDASYRPDRDLVYEVACRPIGAWTPWHTDLIYLPQPIRGGILRAPASSSLGGSTGFMDKIQLFDALPRGTRDRIDGLNVVYRLRLDTSQQRYACAEKVSLIQMTPMLSAFSGREDKTYPPVSHPMVQIQPETGRKMLNLSPMFADHIDGMDNDEGHRLLKSLCEHIWSESFSYKHMWSDEDMVLWDNRRMLLCDFGVDPSIEWIMHRTTIAGSLGSNRMG
jgi:taurine dioxygenase